MNRIWIAFVVNLHPHRASELIAFGALTFALVFVATSTTQSRK